MTSAILIGQATAALSRRVGREILLASLDHEGVESLSETATLVWRLIETPRTAEEVSRLVAEAYSVPEGTVTEDVRSFLADLVRRGWAEEVSG